MTEKQTEMPVTTEDAPAAAPHHHVVGKRPRTGGEKLFDVITYLGIALGANEILSATIGEKLAPTKFFQWAKANVMKTPYFKRFDYVGKGRIADLLLLCVGGMLTVIPVKFMEDAKGSIVRTFDRWFHGAKSDTDPVMIEAHKEMDAAPKQSWSSLGNGRLITLASAIGLDIIVGQPDALSTKLFKKDSPLNDYSSMERIAATVARKVVNFFDKGGAARRADAINQKKFYEIAAGEGRAVRWTDKGIFLTLFSLTLTALFYTTSKAFATKDAIKEDRREDALQPRQAETIAAVAPATKEAAVKKDGEPREEKPATKVQHIAHQRLQDSPVAAHAAGAL